jgi:hypothetical protein
MATQNQVNIGINVSDNGTAKKTVKNFEEITRAANTAQRAAGSINTPVGGTSGSRAVFAKSAPSGSQALLSGEEYGRARGSAGATGASARDFANQAQGLGGLVRLYATLAANVFAASAAFTALSNAADTTNLVKGLDTLGAASGQALGSLSKRLVEATDGAVSLREAMTATATASSAGMSGKNIERLALVAKNASLALGVAMPDALNRLSRGIVKLEPELLDELGLFTKIGPATERYALEIGKSVNALTDFERRQAFANAVLEEGEKKFGALASAAANPYDKLLSNLKNVIQSGLELVNKVLAPIVSLLAESPTALAAVLAGIGVVLLKQALPAIGQLRAGLKNSAEDAFNAANSFKESFGDEFQTILEKRFKIPDLEAGVKKAELDLAKLKFPGKMPESIINLTDEKGLVNLNNVNDRLKDRNKIIATGMKGSKEASEAQIAAAKQEVAYINKAIELYSKKQALEAGREGLQEVADIAPGRWDAETIAIQKYNKLRDKVDRANAISNAAQNAQIAGIRGSWALLNTEVAEKGITGFAKYSTLAQGGLAAIGTRVMGIVSSLGRVGEVVGLSIAGFMLLDGWLSKNTKQAEKFNQGLTTAEEAVANVARTISAATTIEGFATSTIDNTVAFSNALNELSSSLDDIIKLSREADKAAGLWDNFWDSIFSVVNKDRASKLSKTVATQIQSSIRLLSREGLGEEYKAQLKAILQVDDLDDFDKVSKAWKNLSKTQQDAVVAIQNNANRALGNASSALQSFKDKTDEALKAQKVLSNSFLDSSPAFKYGESLVAVSTSLNTLIGQGPERVAQALQEISDNMEKGAMFGSEFVGEFGKISAEFGRQKSVIDGLNAALIDYKKQLSTANSEVKKVDTRAARGQSTETLNVRGSMFRSDQPEVRTNQRGAAFSAANAEKTSAAMISSDYVREVQKALNAAPRDAVDKSLKLVEAAAKSLFDRGMAFIGKAVRDAQTTASITIGKALTSNLTGPQKLQADAAFAQQEIKARLADIKISEQMMDTQNQLVNEMKLANALQAEANILQKSAGKPDANAVEKAAKEVQKARLGVSGVGTEGMLNSDLLSDKEKADIKEQQARQKMVQQAALQPAKILAKSQLDASQIGLKSELPLLQAQQEEELKKITDRTNASLMARQDIMSGIASVTSAEVITSKQNAELREKALQQDRELGAINDKIAQAEKLYAEALTRKDEGAKTAQQGQLAQLNFLEKQKQLTEEAQSADTSLVIAKNKQQLLAQELSDLDKRYEVITSTRDLENQAAVSRLDSQNQLLSLQASANQYSQEYVIASQTALDKEKALLDTNIAMQQAQDTLAQKQAEAEIRIAALRADGATKNKAVIDAETAELDRQETLTNNAITGLNNQYNSKIAVLDKTKEINTEQAKYNELLENSSALATALGNAFGDLGTKLGGLTSALVDIAVSSEKGAKALADLEFDRDAENDPKKKLALEKEVLKQQDKNIRSELAGNAKIAGAAKSLFKEKTVAYKTFAAVEKGLQIASLALEMKTTLTKMGLWAAEVPAKVTAEAGVTAAGAAGAAARAPLTFGEIVGNYLAKIPPPFGMIAGVAAGAYFLSLLGKSGSSSGAFVPNAEQRQETQGTAMSYDSAGNKVQVRRGVFGDENAKSESIANSLELIKSTSVDGLSYDNKMVTLLTSIDNGINNAAKGLYGIQGLRSGTMFGTVQGTQSGGGLLGTGLFGSKTSRNITDSGIIIEGTFAQLASDTNKAVLDFFEQVTVSKKSWYGKTKTWVETYRNEVDDATSEFFQGVFGDATKLFVEVGKLAGVSKDTIDQILGSFNLTQEFASLRGLKGEEFQKELSSIIGAVLDDASLAIFSSFEQFANFGEGMTETVIRVIDTNTKINQLLKNINSTTPSLTQLYTVTEALANAAGGLEEFISQANYFSENFYTEAERAVPAQKAVIAQLKNLGYESVDTKAEFKSLVQSLDLTTSAGQQTYQSLMDLAPGFIDVIDAVEAQSQTLKDAASNFRDFIVQIREFKNSLLLGAISTLTPGQKYAEAQTQFEAIYAQALAGDQTAMSKVTSSAQTFLEASKTYFASSDAYTRDFNTVLSKLDNATISAGASASVAELQLNALSIHTDLLSSINTNIATIAGVPQAAGGGRVKGLTLVGELGPELVDFTNPGQVYTADQTAGMFAPKAGVSNNMNQVVQELRQVRQEIAQLRKDQQQQTGDLIVSNYDANNRAAEVITTEVANTATQKEWQQRNKVAVV